MSSKLPFFSNLMVVCIIHRMWENSFWRAWTTMMKYARSRPFIQFTVNSIQSKKVRNGTTETESYSRSSAEQFLNSVSQPNFRFILLSGVYTTAHELPANRLGDTVLWNNIYARDLTSLNVLLLHRSSDFCRYWNDRLWNHIDELFSWMPKVFRVRASLFSILSILLLCQCMR